MNILANEISKEANSIYKQCSFVKGCMAIIIAITFIYVLVSSCFIIDLRNELIKKQVEIIRLKQNV